MRTNAQVTQNVMDEADQLAGWKEIANYLVLSVRTAQNYELTLGLPIVRLDGQPKSRVYASRAALDEWRTRTQVARGAQIPDDPPAPVRPRRNAWVAALVGVVVVAGAVWSTLRPIRQIAGFQVRERTLIATDNTGAPLWEFAFPGRPVVKWADPTTTNRTLITDLDGDGAREFLFIFRNEDSPLEPLELYCFSASGERLWRHRAGRELRTARSGVVYPGSYDIRWVETLHKPTGAGGVLLVGSSRGPTSMFVVELLRADGSLVGEYYHPGWLWSVLAQDLDGDGTDEVLLGGVNNAYGSQTRGRYPMTLVVLDARRIDGQGPAPPDDERHFNQMTTGAERAVLLLPGFGHLESDPPSRICLIRYIRSIGSAIEVSAAKIDGHEQFNATYTFDRMLALKNVLPSPDLADLLHRSAPPSDSEAFANRIRRLALEQVGNLKVLKNEFAVPPSA